MEIHDGVRGMTELAELFDWAVMQSEAAAHLPPLAIHQASMPRDHTVAPIKAGDIIRARPFTIAFERYIDKDDSPAPILTALADIHSDPSLRLEFEVVWAIVLGGHTDFDALDAILGRPRGFEEAATRGLRLLREKTTHLVQKQLTETSQRRETAGQAQQAREDDQPKKKRGRVTA